MIPARYSAPGARSAFNDENRFVLWKEITDAYALTMAREIYDEDTAQFAWIQDAFNNTSAPSPEMVAEYEEQIGHDVVAFLQAYCTKLPGNVHHLVHDGLTSSDLVDYGLFRMTATHAQDLAGTLSDLTYLYYNEKGRSIRPGRTHGQLADHTTWQHQLRVMLLPMLTIRASLEDLYEHLPAIKSPGPTGWPGAFPEVNDRGLKIADLMRVEFVEGTQIIHRDRLLEWACIYLRLACALENLAQLVRAGARADVAEVAEGAARTGSSSMPHKQNPIDCEKVCGLARVARGYFNAIAESVATWDDRDISNSSVERVAVPGLAEVVEHMTRVMAKVMLNLVVDEPQMAAMASNARCFTNIYQVMVQRHMDVGPVDAANIVRSAIADYQHMPGAWTRAVQDQVEEHGGNGRAWRDDVLEEIDQRFGRGTPDSSEGAGGPQ